MKTMIERASGRSISRRGLFGLSAAAAALLALRIKETLAGAALLVRRNAAALSANERAEFVNALKASRAVSSQYDPSTSMYDRFTAPPVSW